MSKKIEPKTVLITGIAGLIGSHLCRYELERGSSVIGMDNFLTGNERNIIPHYDDPNFKFVEHDIRDPINLEVDQIYNLACPASPLHYQKIPIITFETIVEGTRNMLELARKNGSRILQASTSEVYGDPEEHPQGEGYVGKINHLGPRACYDEGKKAAETLCFDYKRQFDVNVAVARIFNTYGTNVSREDGRVVSNFILQALRNDPLTIYGDGGQTRSFCYVSDLIKGLHILMNKENFTGPINLGNPDEISMNDLADEVIQLTESSSTRVYNGLPEDDPKRRCPNINLAKTELNWEPEIKLKDGLVRTITHLRKGNRREIEDAVESDYGNKIVHYRDLIAHPLGWGEVEMRLIDSTFNLNSDLEGIINNNWEEASSIHSHLFNEPRLRFENIKLNDEGILVIEVSYGVGYKEHHALRGLDLKGSLPSENQPNLMTVNALQITRDNYILVGVRNPKGSDQSDCAVVGGGFLNVLTDEGKISPFSPGSIFETVLIEVGNETQYDGNGRLNGIGVVDRRNMKLCTVTKGSNGDITAGVIVPLRANADEVELNKNCDEFTQMIRIKNDESNLRQIIETGNIKGAMSDRGVVQEDSKVSDHLIEVLDAHSHMLDRQSRIIYSSKGMLT